MKYASFLMENYFPVHDLACKAEGYYMNRYLAGDKRAEAILHAMKGQIPEMQNELTFLLYLKYSCLSSNLFTSA